MSLFLSDLRMKRLSHILYFMVFLLHFPIPPISQNAGKSVRTWQILRNFFCLSFFESGFFRKLLGFLNSVCVKLNTERKDCRVCAAAVD